ncbi:MAG: efflux RND transporter periplasmic adaptor subunit [Desulfobulbaceae bacterium]|nr:efflux RND transporter periplasmic adaptor subunit [Desulfobulbaceae bacterium]
MYTFRMRHTLYFLALFATLLVVAMACCASATQAQPPPATTMQPAAVAVRISPVRSVDTMWSIQVPGTVEAVQRSTIAARIGATVADVPVKLGTAVEKGEVLVRLQAAELNARAAQARAQLEQVRRNLARDSRLQAQGAATAEAVRSLRDQERIAVAALAEAEAMLAYTVITAPYAGVISKKMVNTGDLASPGMVLLELENATALQVRAQAPEETLSRLQIDTMLPVLLPGTGEELSARLVEIAPAANPAARSATVILALVNADFMRSGQYVQVHLPGTGSQSLVVPAAAVSRWGQMERVFVLEENRARLRLVRTGARDDHRDSTFGDNIEIITGLDEGEQVIISDPAQLVHGQQVLVQP